MKRIILWAATVLAFSLILPQGGHAADSGPPMFRVYCEWTVESDVFTKDWTVEPRGLHKARYDCAHLFGGRVVGFEIVRN